MKKVILFLAIFSFCWLHAASQIYDAIINLGGDCQVAYQLYIHGLREYALPFDTFITPCSSVQKILAEDFKDFIIPDNFELVKTGTQASYVLDKTYGIRLIHDFRLNDHFLDDYEEFAIKYTRRIERMIILIKNATYPLFIRKNITKADAIELAALLSKLRGHKPFLLLALDTTEEIKMTWNIPNTINFYLQQPTPYVWRGDKEAWKTIFMALSLKLSSSFEALS